MAASRVLTQLAQAARAGGTRLYVSPLVLDEVWWKLRELFYDEAHKQEHAWRRLRWSKRKAALEQHAADITAVTHWLAGGNLVTVTNVRPEDVPTALQYATHAAEPHLAPAMPSTSPL
jgi:O-methyltransferase involved in polyketide biosynthesis